MNCLILNLSRINPRRDVPAIEREYTAPGEKLYTGVQTNEAPSKYFFDSLAEKNSIFEKIVILETKECRDKFEKLNNLSTHEYYIASLKKYIESEPKTKTLILDRYNSVDEYFDSVVRVINLSEKEKLYKNIFDTIRESKTDSEYYIDFTGGSRVDILILLFVCRLVESVNGKVLDMIYANINHEKPEITSCTAYYNLFSNVERMAAAFDKPEDQAEILEQLGIIDEEEAKMLSGLNEIIEKTSGVRRADEDTKQKIEKIKEEAQKTNGTVADIENNAINKSEIKIKKSPFKKFLDNYEKKTDDLVSDYYEQIIGVFYDEGVVRYTGTDKGKAQDRIKDAFKANIDYYEGAVDRKNRITKNGVMPVVKKWLSQLFEHTVYNPVKHYEVKTRVQSSKNTGYFYNSYIDNYYYVNGINKESSDYFFNCLDESGFNYGGEDSKRVCRNVVDLQRKYFNCGFPFMCAYKNRTYPEIWAYYQEKVSSLMQRLSDLKEENEPLYRQRVKELSNDGNELSAEIPLLLEIPGCYEINGERFKNEEDKKDFLVTLSERLEKVRPYRNAIVHKSEDSSNFYMQKSNHENIANEIKQWLKEYEEKFRRGE